MCSCSNWKFGAGVSSPREDLNEPTACTVAETDFISLAAPSQINDIWLSLRAQVGVARSSKSNSPCLNVLRRIFKGIAEEIETF
jgi:hypothetical protein